MQLSAGKISELFQGTKNQYQQNYNQSKPHELMCSQFQPKIIYLLESVNDDTYVNKRIFGTFFNSEIADENNHFTSNLFGNCI